MKKFISPVGLTLIFALIFHSCINKKAELSLSENQDHLIMSVLWFQKSAEMRALFIQGYNIASEKLIEAAAIKDKQKPLAVVADIDETVLDNSPFEGWQITSGNSFSDKTWKTWTDMAVAKALPGALDFARAGR
ncbi:MAG: hypothetical protein MZV63_59945 [Marinilabiliales bacterium]|nr:hypothetical protein [Marinilabiliales bacterium]